MKNIAQPAVAASMRKRLKQLESNTPALWGKMSAQQMLLHITGGMEQVVKGQRFTDLPNPPSLFQKIFGLYLPIPWPKGIKTKMDPAGVECDPVAFEKEKDRALAALDALTSADPSTFPDYHPAFGSMKGSDWFRWAYKHNDHHLRQFAL